MHDLRYGPIREIDGFRYRVRRGMVCGHHDRGRWDLLRLNDSGAAEVDAFVHLPLDATVSDAERRLLGNLLD